MAPSFDKTPPFSMYLVFGCVVMCQTACSRRRGWVSRPMFLLISPRPLIGQCGAARFSFRRRASLRDGGTALPDAARSRRAL